MSQTPDDGPPSDQPAPEPGPEEPAPGGPELDEERMEELVRLAQSCLEMARTGDTGALVAYIDAGVPIDLTDAAGNTVLMLAAHHGHPGTVAALAERGADVDRVNDRGRSPLAGAIFETETEVVAVLLEHGADPDHGTPSAREAAAVFGQAGLLEGGSGG